MKVFKCPLGIDPTTGQPYQVSYGMNYVNGGPNGKRLIDLTNGNGASGVLIVWDHAKTPGCANSAIAALPTPAPNGTPRGPAPFPDPAMTHYPQNRHTGIFNALYCDGHVQGMTQNDLSTPLFLANTSVPVYP